jgi:hypothetical protein
MQSDVSRARRLSHQDSAIARLLCETQLLRDENARLVDQLEAARRPEPVEGDRFEARLPAGPGGPAAARATLTRWLTGRVPGEVRADVRLLASELVASSGGLEPPYEAAALLLAAELRDGVLRVDLRAVSRHAARRPDLRRGGFGLQIVEALASRWGAEDGETHLWFEVDATGTAAVAGGCLR